MHIGVFSMKVIGIKNMFVFDGCTVKEIRFGMSNVEVRIDFDRRRRPRCPACNSIAGREERRRSSARDIPFGLAQITIIDYEKLKVNCSKCGQRSWLSPAGIIPRRGITRRLQELAVRLARDLSICKAAEYLDVPETTLRRWDKAYLKEMLPEPELDGLRVLLIDEKSIGRGHNYITIVLNGDTGELLHCEEGKKGDALRSFINRLPESVKTGIEAACVDRGGAYISAIEELLPHVDLVFDKYHLVSNFNKVVDEVRRDQWNTFRKDKDDDGAKAIKNQRYNLLRRPENNTEEQQDRLEKLLEINEPLSKVYILLEDFRDILSERYLKYAKPNLEDWLETAKNSGLAAVKTFATNLEKRTEQVLNIIKHDITNGLIEGFNNLVSRIIHRGCGYHDLEYLTLKLRQVSHRDVL